MKGWKNVYQATAIDWSSGIDRLKNVYPRIWTSWIAGLKIGMQVVFQAIAVVWSTSRIDGLKTVYRATAIAW